MFFFFFFFVGGWGKKRKNKQKRGSFWKMRWNTFEAWNAQAPGAGSCRSEDEMGCCEIIQFFKGKVILLGGNILYYIYIY